MIKWLKGLSLATIVAFSGAVANDNILITAEEAVKLIGRPNVVFVNGDAESAFGTGHIKGSVSMEAHHLHHADITGHMHCAPLFMCPDEASEYIGSKGINNDTLVVAYDDYRGPNATGVYAFFKSYGHERLKILNGGRKAILKIDENQIKYDKLNDEKKALKKEIKTAKKAKDDVKVKELTKKASDLKNQLAELEKLLLVQKGHEEKKEHKEYYIDPSEIKYDYIAGKQEILKAVHDIEQHGKDSKYIIVDSRGFTEIIGERKMDNVARGGHVPGATFLEWKKIYDPVNELSFKSKEEMQKVFDQYGITKDKTIYAYCHVGAGRSTEITTALELLGYPNVKVYTGSWDEWGNDMNLPIKR